MTANVGYKSNLIKLSIIIVGWNTREYLEGCLNSIYENPPSCKFEVIYVDNGSEDGSVKLVREQYPEAIIIENDENLGFQKANNQGLGIAQGQYIILLNSDTVILPGTFDKMLSFMEAHPEVGAASPKCLYPDGRIQWSISHFPSVRSLWWWFCSHHWGFRSLVRFRKRRPFDVNQTQEQDYAYGAFLTLRRGVLDDVGFMDETFFSYGDDAGWSWRMKAKGWKVYYVAHVEAIHYGGRSASKRAKAITAEWILAHRILLYRYRGLLYGMAGDAIFLTDLAMNSIESLAHCWLGKREGALFERHGDCWQVFREVYLRKELRKP